jgi:hypothetical protein
MSHRDPESLARHQRVQRLCRELSQLLQVSLEQRRVIDDLMNRLEKVTRGARRPLGRSAGRGGDGLITG